LNGEWLIQSFGVCTYGFIHYEDVRIGGRDEQPDHMPCWLEATEPTYASLRTAIRNVQMLRWDDEDDEPRLATLEARAFRLLATLRRLNRDIDGTWTAADVVADVRHYFHTGRFPDR